MIPTDIEKLFLSVVDDPGKRTDATHAVFAVLVNSTLAYRDHMIRSQGVVVTVEDVRETLAWLVPVLTTGQLPETENDIRLGLLKIWLRKLA